jgi:hypothetical protein
LYAVFLGLGISQLPAGAGFGFGYEQVRQFLAQSPLGFIGGWIHYLVFDLFVGFWVYKEGLRLNIPTWQTSLCLLFVLLMGPLGGVFNSPPILCHACVRMKISGISWLPAPGLKECLSS